MSEVPQKRDLIEVVEHKTQPMPVQLRLPEMPKLRRAPEIVATPKGGIHTIELTSAVLALIKVVCESEVNPSLSYICKRIGIRPVVMQDWLERYPELQSRIDTWRMESIAELRRSAKEQALDGNATLLKMLLEKRDNDFSEAASDALGGDDIAGGEQPDPTFL